MMTNLETVLKKTVMKLTDGFSWIQEAILYRKITNVCDTEDSFENDAIVLFA